MFKRRQAAPEILVGSKFQRVLGGQVVETVQVLAVAPDLVGIPHVHFSVHHERTAAADDLRTLAVASFAATFTRRVAA